MITVNEERMEWRDGLTVADVLQARNYKFPLLIISIDGAFVPRTAYGKTTIPDGAVVTVVHLISGG